MPSIQDIAKKANPKMFKQANARSLDEILPLNQEETSHIEASNIYSPQTKDEILPLNQEETSHIEALNIYSPQTKRKAFKKVAYRPWDDDQPSRVEGQGGRVTKLGVSKVLLNEERTNKANGIDVEEATAKNNFINFYQTKSKTFTPKKIIISLYGVQRNILKFLLNNISHEEDSYTYTYPIDLKSIVMFTSSSKNTVDTSIRRMKEKKIIESWDHKRGRGSYVTFRIPNILKDEFLSENNRPIQPNI